MEKGNSGSAWNTAYLTKKARTAISEAKKMALKSIKQVEVDGMVGFVGWISKVTTRLIYVDYKPTSA